MKLKDLLNTNKQPAKYIDTPDGTVKICEQGPLPKTNFVYVWTSNKYKSNVDDELLYDESAREKLYTLACPIVSPSAPRLSSFLKL